MKNNLVETIVGFAVIILALSFFFFAKNQANVTSDSDSYQINANFAAIDGISVGSDVRVAGIKIGTVAAEDLDSYTYEASLKLAIDNDVKIPTDSIASVVSSGLLGKKYVAIDPGADETYLKSGDKILYTQASVNLETLIGKFIFKED